MVMALVFVQGCLTEQQAARRIMRVQALQPSVVAAACGSLYPPLEYRRDSIIYKQGAPAPMVYVYADCDSIPQPVRKKIKILCPPSRTVDTLVLYREKQVVNRGAVEALRSELAACNISRARLAKERQILLWLSIVLLLLLVLRRVMKTWRK